MYIHVVCMLCALYSVYRSCAFCQGDVVGKKVMSLHFHHTQMDHYYPEDVPSDLYFARGMKTAFSH